MRPRVRAIAVLLAMTAAAHGELARANPSGASVAAGAATFQSNGRTLTVTNAHGTIINWQAFSIGAGETTRFLQSSSLSAVLNRVTGGDPSSIFGTLSSNGRVFLINPNGLVFGAGAVIDTAGFVASTLNIADRDFLAGRLKFEGGGAGVLRNEGTIHASGDIYLVGPRVENAGLIRSDGGGVALAAGQSVTITGPDAQGIQFALQAPADSALNLGSIDAHTAAGMFAGTLRHSGDLRAMSASLDAAGRVTLSASREAVVEAGATIAAGDAEGRGGNVLVWSDQDTRVHGAIDAPGGFVETSGRRRLDVSGIRLHAPGGTWLLDPYNIEIVAGAATANNGGAPGFTPSGDDSQIGADLITGQLDAGTSVTISTGLGGSPGTQAGNITVSSPVVKTAVNNASLTLTTANDIAVNANVTLPGDNSKAIFNAGNQFSINSATVQAANVSVNAGGNITRSGAQASDFLYGRAFPETGSLTLSSTGGAIGAPGSAIRFRNIIDTGGRGWAAGTSAAGAAGDIYLNYTGSSTELGAGSVVTAAGSTQTVSLQHSGSGGNIAIYVNAATNDDWIINSSGGYRYGGATLTANSVTANLAGSFGAGGVYSSYLYFDTSAANGNITLTADNFTGTGAGGDQNAVGVKPGTGIVTATSTGSGVGGQGTSGSIQLQHFGGDLLTSRYNLNFTGGTAGTYARLRAADGHLIADSTAGFNASLNNKEILLQTHAAGKDIVFQGGTVQGGRVEVRAARNIDNLAPGTDGFIQTNAFGGPHWMLIAGGGIGATNPVEGRADWVGSVATSGAGAAGDIRIKFNGGATPRFGEVRTAAGSAQNISIDSAVGLVFSTAQPGYGGVGGGGSSSVTANDNYSINATGSISFDNFDNSFTANTITMTSGGSIVHGVTGGGDMMATTGLLTMNANGGSIGSPGNPARLRGSGTKTLYARDDIYIHAGSNPLTLTGLTTGAGAGTIGLTTTAANDLTIGGTTNIDDALVLTTGGNIIFPAAASFTTSGGLTLNSQAQIASTAAVSVTGGSLSGSGAVTNAGTLGKSGAGVGDFSGGFSNTGTVNVNGGTLGFSGGYTDGGGALVLGGGTVTAPAAGLVFNTGQLSGVGTITGKLTNNGVLNVGASPGTLVINGDYTQGASGVLNVELGGTAQGVNYDLLQVTGTANLGGTLNASFFGPFVGAAGNVYDVITYVSRSGDFAAVNFPAGASMSATPNTTFYRIAQLAPPAGGGSGTGTETGTATTGGLPAARSQIEVALLNDRFVMTEGRSVQQRAHAGLELADRPTVAMPEITLASDGGGLPGGGTVIFAQPPSPSSQREKEVARQYENQKANEGMIILRNQDVARDHLQTTSGDTIQRAYSDAYTGEFARAKAEGVSSFEAAGRGREAGNEAMENAKAEAGLSQMVVNGTVDVSHLQGLNARQGLALGSLADKAAQMAGLHGGSGKDLLGDLGDTGALEGIKDKAKGLDPDGSGEGFEHHIGLDIVNQGFQNSHGISMEQYQRQQEREAAGDGSSQSASAASSGMGKANDYRPDNGSVGSSGGEGAPESGRSGNVGGASSGGGAGAGGAASRGSAGSAGNAGNATGSASPPGAAPADTRAGESSTGSSSGRLDLIVPNSDGTWTVLTDNGDGTFSSQSYRSEEEAWAAAGNSGGAADAQSERSGASSSETSSSKGASDSTGSAQSGDASSSGETSGGSESEDGSGSESSGNECTGEDCSGGETASGGEEAETETADADKEGGGRPNPMSDGPVSTAYEVYVDTVLGGGHRTRQQLRAIESASGGNVTNPGDNPDATGAGGSTSPDLDAKNIGLATGGGVGGGRTPQQPEPYSAINAHLINLRAGGAVTDPPREGDDKGSNTAPLPFIAGPAPTPGSTFGRAAAGAVIETIRIIQR